MWPPKCYLCFKHLASPGALYFGIPNQSIDDSTELAPKIHICHECNYQVMADFEYIRSTNRDVQKINKNS